jgi:hypothetical protein
MFRRSIVGCLVFFTALVATSAPSFVQAAGVGQPHDWHRFYYYPYVYYPANFQRPQQYNSLYYRYPAERRIPVYNSDWHNFYPQERPYYRGHHFILDVF